MPQHFIVSFIGNDRTGLVEEVAETIRGHGGNWLESQLSHLEGKFAGLILIDLPSAEASALEHGLTNLPSGRASVRVTSVVGNALASSANQSLELMGPDRQGIVKEISRALSDVDINIVAMDSSVENAAFTGEPMFKAKLEVSIPSGVDLAQLQDRLDSIADAMMLEIDLH